MTAQRYKCIVQYDGTSYVGYQVQPNGNSVQTEIEKALKKMSNGQIIPIQASGRTDSGVHALDRLSISITRLRLSRIICCGR